MARPHVGILVPCDVSTCPGGVWKLTLCHPLQLTAGGVSVCVHIRKARCPELASFSTLYFRFYAFYDRDLSSNPPYLPSKHLTNCPISLPPVYPFWELLVSPWCPGVGVGIQLGPSVIQLFPVLTVLRANRMGMEGASTVVTAQHRANHTVNQFQPV